MCKVGILDMVEKNKWRPNYIVYVPINGRQTKMYMTETYMATIGRLQIKVSQTGDSELQKKVYEILEGGKSFDEIELKIPRYLRESIFKQNS